MHIVLLAAIQAAAILHFVPQADIDAPFVRLADVADVSVLPQDMRARAGALRLATIPAGARRLLPNRWAASRARSLMPALAPWLPRDDARFITIRSHPSPGAAAARACARVLTPIAAGVVPTRRDFAPVPCSARVVRSGLRYDPRSRVVRADSDLAVGDTTIAVSPSSIADVREGDHMRIAVKIGPVLVERNVEAAQPAPRGHDLFVQTPDHTIFAARASEIVQ